MQLVISLTIACHTHTSSQHHTLYSAQKDSRRPEINSNIGIKIWPTENLKNVDVLRYCVVAVSIF